MRVLKIPSWLISLLLSWLFFLFGFTTYRILRKRSFNNRLRALLIITLLIYWGYKKGRERIERNISLIRPDLTSQEIAQGSWKLAKMIARSWAAMLGNEFISLDEIKKRVEVQGIETLLDYYRRGKKIIAVACHIGPIDEMIGLVPVFGLRVYIPAEPIRPKWLFNLMMRLRLKFGDIIFEEVEKGQILINAAYHLSDGRIVVLLVDMPPRRDESGVSCQIGRAKARFPVGAVKLALEENATIFPVFPSLTEDGKAKIVIGPPFELIRTDNLQRDIEINVCRLIEGVYATFIQENFDSWLRLPWIKLELIEIP